MHGLPLLSLAIWVPIIAGVAVLFTGGDRNAPMARMIALIGAVIGFAVTILMEKYGLDRFNDWFFAGGARALGTGLWKGGDIAVIDNVMVNGSARLVGWIASVVRQVQSGYIYHYAFAMIIGVLLLLTLAYSG